MLGAQKCWGKELLGQMDKEQNTAVVELRLKDRPLSQRPGFASYRLLAVTLGRFISLCLVSPLLNGDDNSTYLREF